MFPSYDAYHRGSHCGFLHVASSVGHAQLKVCQTPHGPLHIFDVSSLNIYVQEHTPAGSVHAPQGLISQS